jgi:outer membrane protein, multidrug efflux system
MRNSLQIKFVAKAPPILLTALTLSGCAVGPNYHRPVVQAPTVFHAPDVTQGTGTQPTSFADLPWWQVFHDAQLHELIRTALKQNYDLQLAVERVNAARAQVGITRSNEFPQVSLTRISAAEKPTRTSSPTFFSSLEMSSSRPTSSGVIGAQRRRPAPSFWAHRTYSRR